jgi:cytochrome c-type biogenesis protein CcmH/NrfF
MQTVMACMPLALLVVGGYLAFRYHRRLRSSLTSAYKQVRSVKSSVRD